MDMNLTSANVEYHEYNTLIIPDREIAVVEESHTTAHIGLGKAAGKAVAVSVA